MRTKWQAMGLLTMAVVAGPAYASGLTRVGSMAQTAYSDILLVIPIVAALAGVGMLLAWWWHWIPAKTLARGAVALVAIGSIDAIVAFCMGR